MRVVFIDTSVLCHLLPVPGRDKAKVDLKAKFREFEDASAQFVLPITTVIETGNFIAQLKDGEQRRKAANTMRKTLQLIVDGKSPWVLHDIKWDANFLREVLRGAATGMSYVEHAEARLGMGDLCILTECQAYVNRTMSKAEIWTIDEQLSSFSSVLGED